MNTEITINNDLGRKKCSFRVGIGEDTERIITLETGVWNYGAIVSALVRTKYSESDVEAIINNNIALIAMPSTVDEEDGKAKLSEFQELQEWREKCKARAKELLAIGEEMGLVVTD